jgi:hypothetical protein
MSSAVFQVMNALDDAKVCFMIARLRRGAITFFATFVGERWEIEVFEDDHIEISRFVGDEGIEEGGMELLLERIKTELG